MVTPNDKIINRIIALIMVVNLGIKCYIDSSTVPFMSCLEIDLGSNV